MTTFEIILIYLLINIIIEILYYFIIFLINESETLLNYYNGMN